MEEAKKGAGQRPFLRLILLLLSGLARACCRISSLGAANLFAVALVYVVYDLLKHKRHKEGLVATVCFSKLIAMVGRQFSYLSGVSQPVYRCGQFGVFLCC